MVNFALLELNIILSPIRLTNKFQFIGIVFYTIERLIYLCGKSTA